VVAVVALGIALWLGWTALDAATAGSPGGWFNSAPSNGVIYGPTQSALQSNEWLRLAVQLCFVGVWLVGSAWLLSDPAGRRSSPDGEAGGELGAAGDA
jgi:hypothetical protein